MATRTVLRGGHAHSLTEDDHASLLDAVRRAFGVTSASKGCEDGTCGTCRVLLDGKVVNACQVRWTDVRERATLETYEDLEAEPAAVRAVAVFQAERPTRCSLCVGGLGVAAVALARAGKAGDPVAIAEMLATGTCFCTGRGSLRRALSG